MIVVNIGLELDHGFLVKSQFMLTDILLRIIVVDNGCSSPNAYFIAGHVPLWHCMPKGG